MLTSRAMLAVVLLACGCGGASTKAPGNQMSEAGAPSEGTTASAGGSESGGAANIPPPADLGDGDHAGDGRPVVPTESTGGFFWRGCGEESWRLGNWFVTSDLERDAPPREIEPPRGDSTTARGASGAELAAGVVLWVQLDHPSNRAVSLAGCTAMSFWARLESASGQVIVALNDGSQISGLADGRSTLASRELEFGPDWHEFVLPFESFPVGDTAPDSLSVTSIEFFVGQGGETFDFWVDDLTLIP